MVPCGPMARLFLRKFGVEIPLSKAAPERTSHLSERACMPEHVAALGGIAEAAVPQRPTCAGILL